MAYPILGIPRPYFLDSSGDPLTAGEIAIQNPTDSAVKASYPTADKADSSTDGTSANVSLNSFGQPSQDIWGRDGEDYKIVVYSDAGSTTVNTYDDIRLPGPHRQPTVTFTSTDDTPTVVEGNLFITAGTTAITDFDNGEVGDVKHIRAESTITITHNANISLLGEQNFNMVSGDSLTIAMYNDQVWEEIGRSHASSILPQRKTEAVGSFTNTLTADESGKILFLDLVGGGSTVLPAAAAGLEFTFIVKTAPTTAYTIDTPSGANIMDGVLLDIVGELVYAADRDIISFVASTSLSGDRVDVVCDGTTWHYKAFSGANGGITTGQT